ncbi:MAG: sensor histidine kinase [Jaaginema sp. PMC 1079.18]|nr:sensor histidine kinase [Jaaginema sp. PMC 1080.18]MEC4854003.1 sensor histidine kinase [Jaaginema sp. PMC 1079.18]MEC4865032.1 sensor histidine kinase [Jaaginema sp. PMC 1078.18]
MPDISQTFAENLDRIYTIWKQRVRDDRKIKSSQKLTESALGNSVPKFLDGIVNALSQKIDEPVNEIAIASLEHGTHRFEQGFDIREVAREYRLLRETIFDVLAETLLELSAQEQQHTFRLIDAIIDEASADCFQQFVDKQLEDIDKVRKQQILNYQEISRLLQLNQTNFSYLAHEIKNPLQSIMGYSELLLNQQQKSEENNSLSLNHIEQVLMSSRQLLQLVNDSLALARSQREEYNLNLQSFSLVSFLKNAIATIQPLADAKKLDLKLTCDRAPENITTDLTYLQQIVNNLLSNAVRYTDTGYIETIAETLENEQYAIIIRDTGIGIDAEEYDDVFEPFTRASSNIAAVHRQGSTGLGLAIVKRLVTLLKGKIILESTLDRGSAFTVIFPQHLA